MRSVPHERDEAERGYICLTPHGLQHCCRAHPSLWQLPEIPILAPKNQAVSGSGLVPYCVSIFS